jgi:hypothetical protein
MARTFCSSVLELKIGDLASDHVVAGEGMHLWWQTHFSAVS